MLDANAKPYQSGINREWAAGEAGVGHAGGVLNEPFYPSETFCQRKQPCPRYKCLSCFSTAPHDSTYHAARSVHLSSRQFALGMAAQSGIIDNRERGMIGHKLGNCHTIRAVTLHSQG